MWQSRSGTALLAGLTAAVIFFLYAPLVYPLWVATTEYFPESQTTQFTLKWFQKMATTPIIVQSARNTAIAALATALITPVLAVAGALAVREFRIRRTIVILFILPLFIPGVSMGLSTAFFFKTVGIQASLWTIIAVHVIWALPFAFLIVLTAMSSFNTVLLEAAYLSGANAWRAFRDVELPHLRAAITSSAIFAAIISFNETVRTSLVQGPNNTIQTYIWSTFLQVGLSPALFAVMATLTLVTLALVAFLIAAAVRSARTIEAEKHV
jgi:ABC-type spermidine/putrescine transport system permease subunit II